MQALVQYIDVGIGHRSAYQILRELPFYLVFRYIEGTLCRPVDIVKVVAWLAYARQGFSSEHQNPEALVVEVLDELTTYLGREEDCRNAATFDIVVYIYQIQLVFSRYDMNRPAAGQHRVDVYHVGIECKVGVGQRGIAVGYVEERRVCLAEITQRAVFEHTPLWCPCRTGRVEKNEHVVARGFGQRCCILSVGILHHQLAEAEHVAVVPLYRLTSSVGQYQLYSGILQHEGYPLFGQCRVYRHIGRSAFQYACRKKYHLFRALAYYPHYVAATDSRLAQRCCYLVGGGIQFAIGYNPLLVNYGCLVGANSRLPPYLRQYAVVLIDGKAYAAGETQYPLALPGIDKRYLFKSRRGGGNHCGNNVPHRSCDVRRRRVIEQRGVILYADKIFFVMFEDENIHPPRCKFSAEAFQCDASAVHLETLLYLVLERI